MGNTGLASSLQGTEGFGRESLSKRNVVRQPDTTDLKRVMAVLMGNQERMKDGYAESYAAWEN